MTGPEPILALIGFTGSRSFPDPTLIDHALMDVWHDALQDGYDGIELIHGDADGADTTTDDWAVRHGVPRRRRPADWNGPCAATCPPGHRRTNRRGIEYCPLAGHRRNQNMVDERPVLFVAAAALCTARRCTAKAPHDSHGTADCQRRAVAAGIPVLRVTA